MKHEVDLQRELLDAWEKADPYNWGRKLSNSYTSGIPDLLLSGGGTYIVEIKKITDLPIKTDTPIKFDHPLTALQNQSLIRLRRGGTSAGWWAIHRTYHEDAIVGGHFISDIPKNKGEFFHKCLIRKRSQPWGQLFPQMLRWILNP
jgi:hypothetical protein